MIIIIILIRKLVYCDLINKIKNKKTTEREETDETKHLITHGLRRQRVHIPNTLISNKHRALLLYLSKKDHPTLHCVPYKKVSCENFTNTNHKTITKQTHLALCFSLQNPNISFSIAMDSSSKTGSWTNEKHFHFLNSMEASFVRAMFDNNKNNYNNNNDPILRLDRYLPDSSDSTLDLKKHRNKKLVYKGKYMLLV